MEFLAKHNNLDVKRIPVNVKKQVLDDDMINEANKKHKKEIIKDDFEGLEKQEVGYKQIVIFDYETRSK